MAAPEDPRKEADEKESNINDLKRKEEEAPKKMTDAEAVKRLAASERWRVEGREGLLGHGF